MTILRLTRRFDAPRERVFAAWIDPEVLELWWASLPGWEGAEASVDAQPGGRYRLAMREGPAATSTLCTASTPRCARRSGSSTPGPGRASRS
jgi:uncharacterized protein YndB with AHSA1/START domain